MPMAAGGGLGGPGARDDGVGLQMMLMQQQMSQLAAVAQAAAAAGHAGAGPVASPRTAQGVPKLPLSLMHIQQALAAAAAIQQQQQAELEDDSQAGRSSRRSSERSGAEAFPEFVDSDSDEEPAGGGVGRA